MHQLALTFFDPQQKQLTMGENLIDYQGDIRKLTKNTKTEKMLMNRPLSTLNENFATSNLKVLYQTTPMYMSS